MDIVFVGYMVGAIVLTGIATWLVVKNRMVYLMDKLDEAKIKIEEHMDMLPPEAQELAHEVIGLIDEVKISFADNKVSFAETIQIANRAYILYKGFLKLYQDKIVG